MENVFSEKGSYVDFYPLFLGDEESHLLFEYLLHQVSWETQFIKIFGKEVNVPRLVAFYGDDGISYRYSGVDCPAKLWCPHLLGIKKKIERTLGAEFNYLLLNYYRDGNDSMGWHSDNEKSLGESPIIASYSIGETRRMDFREKEKGSGPGFQINLSNDSLLCMHGKTQDLFKHRIAKTARNNGARINLTFRKIIS